MSYLAKIELQRAKNKKQVQQEANRKLKKRARGQRPPSGKVELDRFTPIRDGKTVRCSYCWESVYADKEIFKKIPKLFLQDLPRHDESSCPKVINQKRDEMMKESEERGKKARLELGPSAALTIRKLDGEDLAGSDRVIV